VIWDISTEKSLLLERFNLTDQVLVALKSQKVPEPVLSKLKPLINKEVLREDFVGKLTALLDAAEMEQYQSVLLRQARITRECQNSRVFWDASGPRVGFVHHDIRADIWEAKAGDESRVVGGTWWGKWGEARGAATAVAWSGDRQRLASLPGVGSDTIQVHEISTGAKLMSVTGQRGLSSLAFNPDARLLAVISFDGSIGVWDVAATKNVLNIGNGGKGAQRPGRPILAIAWSPDGKRLAASGIGQSLKIWDAVSGKELATLSGHEGDVSSVAWSPDGKRLLTGSKDRTLKIWDANTGKEAVTMRGHQGEILSVAWSPDGRRVVSHGRQPNGSEGPGALKLWDANTGQEIATWLRQQGPAAWSPDGRRLASVTSFDPGVKPNVMLTVWDAPPIGKK